MVITYKKSKEAIVNKAIANVGSKPEEKSVVLPSDIQTKLTISKSNNIYEQEADDMADQMMGASETPAVQRACENCEEDEVRTKPLFQTITPFIQGSFTQRASEDEEEEPIQAKPDIQKQDEEKDIPVQTKAEKFTASPAIENSINTTQGKGTPLPNNTRSFMENRFGADFENVRVHNDSNAVQLNKQLNAQAFTKGNDIYFNNGKYNLESIEGKHLLAHELTHVIQQDRSIRRQIPGGIVAPKVPASPRAQKLFAWMELPLQAVVISPSKIDKKNWSDDAIAGLVLIYNKMRNENIWQYVKEVIDTSHRVSIDFIPKSAPAFIYNQLFKHNYISCLSDYGTVWGLRKKKACGAHLHFKYFDKTKNEINVHIDEVDPCCGNIPILSRIYYGLKHYFVDKRGWDKRKVGNFITLLKNQKIPLSKGILKHLKKML